MIAFSCALNPVELLLKKEETVDLVLGPSGDSHWAAYEGSAQVNGAVLQALRSLEPELSSTIAAANTKTVLFTGHALGGSIAALAALSFVAEHNSTESGPQSPILVTLGSPGVANTAFVELVNARVAPLGGIRITTSGIPQS